MCEINESPLFLKLNPLAKTNDVGFLFISFSLLHKKKLKNSILLCFVLGLLNSCEIHVISYACQYFLFQLPISLYESVIDIVDGAVRKYFNL